MTDDLDALLARADELVAKGWTNLASVPSLRDLAAAIRTLRNERDAERARADRNAELIGKHDPTGEDHLRDAMEAAERYDTALDVIARLRNGWRHEPFNSTETRWCRAPDDPTVYREWRPITDAERAVLAAAETRHKGQP